MPDEADEKDDILAPVRAEIADEIARRVLELARTAPAERDRLVREIEAGSSLLRRLAPKGPAAPPEPPPTLH
jgi:hypothetical protein